MTKRRSNFDIVLNDQKNLSIQESKRRGRPYLLGLMAVCGVALGLAGVARADDDLVGKLRDAGLSKESVVKASKLIDNKEHNVCTVLANALASKEIVGKQSVKFTENACSNYEIKIEENEIKRIEGNMEQDERRIEDSERRFKEIMGENNGE